MRECVYGGWGACTNQRKKERERRKEREKEMGMGGKKFCLGEGRKS